MTDDARIERLPAWAKSYIQKLEAELRKARQLAEASDALTQPGDRCWHDPVVGSSVLGGPTIRIPTARVHFALDDCLTIPDGRFCYSDAVHARITKEPEGLKLQISGGRSIIVEPRSSNQVVISQVPQ